jgi:hypothetical protein
MLWRNLLISTMTLPGALLPPLRHPPVAMALYYLYTIMQKFLPQVMQRHRMRPRPQRGQGWRKGGDPVS